MDSLDLQTKVIVAFSFALRDYADAVQWMSGSPSFSEQGEAHEGWVKLREQLNKHEAVLKFVTA